MSGNQENQIYFDLLRGYLDSNSDAFFVLSEEMSLLVSNRLMQEWIGEAAADPVSDENRLAIITLIRDTDSRHLFTEKFKQARNSHPCRFECHLHPPKGQARWVEFSLNSAQAAGQSIIIGVAHDVTDQRRVREHALKFLTAIEQISDSVIVTNRDGIIEFVNSAFEKATGYAQQEVLGKNPRILKSGKQAPEFDKMLWASILRGETFHDVLINRRKDGTLFHEEMTITPLKNSHGEITHFISTGKDITERMHFQERLHQQANYDALTGLPNRMLLQDRLAQALTRVRWRQRLVGLLFLDLDRFKIINDTLGHDVGDRVLEMTAERLKQCVREGDTVARLGGDELAIVLDDLAQAEDITPVANKVLSAIAQPYEIDGRELFINASIGISLHPGDANDIKTLIKNADIAMYRAKEQGGNNFQFYSEQLANQSADRLMLEGNLRRALERNEFLLHYQPQVDLRTGEVIGIEALLRWRHPEMGLIAPMNFIPLAEETGLIVPLSAWVLREACGQNKSLQNSGYPPMRIAVNLSARNFLQSDLADVIAAILTETGLEPGYLSLELTESILVQQTEKTVATMRQLQSLGAHIVIDDFGIGYSSLSYLKRLPIDALKIDQSFVRDITTDPNDAAIVTAITTMAHSLDLKVIAEGVESQPQLSFLRTHHCDAMQGFYFSKPVPAELLEKVLRVFGIPARTQPN